MIKNLLKMLNQNAFAADILFNIVCICKHKYTEYAHGEYQKDFTSIYLVCTAVHLLK